MPRISIVLPAFNVENYLAEAVESLLAQTFSDFELLLFDDGSEDRTLDVASSFAARDSRVVLIQGKHSGYVHWLNAGWKMADGELIARMDADDIAMPDRLERQVRFLDSHPECCVVGAQALRIDPDGLPIGPWRVPETHDEIDNRHMDGRPGGIIHPLMTVRRSVLKRIGGYRAQFETAEDYDMLLRLAEVGQIANLPETLLRYRVHAGAVTVTQAEVQSRRTQRALEEAWDRRGVVGMPPKASNSRKRPSSEELVWSWTRSAFAARNYGTARRQSLRLLRQRPASFKYWALFGLASLASFGTHLKSMCMKVLGAWRGSKEHRM